MLKLLPFYLITAVNLLAWLCYWVSIIPLPALLLVHLFSGLFASLAMLSFLPTHYKSTLASTMLFLNMLVLGIPILGVLGLSFSLLPGLYKPKQRNETNSKATRIPPLPYKPIAMNYASYSRGGVFEVLNHSRKSEKRIDAVMATQHMKTRMAVPLLRVALRDTDDDVRLMAYSILDKRESRINKKISDLHVELDRSQGNRRVVVQERLAQQYWEMAYLGLCEGDVKTQMLDKAQEIISRLVGNGKHTGGSAYVLQGKIYLEKDDISQARKSFNGAKLVGVGDAVLLPYFAEIAYRESV